MAGILDIFGAVKAGKEIANPAMWKNAGNLTRLIASILSAGVVLYRIFVGELPITDEQLITISGALATILMMISNVLAVITTKKNVSIIGIPSTKAEDSK